MPGLKSKSAKSFRHPHSSRIKKSQNKGKKNKLLNNSIIHKTKTSEKNKILTLSVKDSKAFFETMETPFIPDEKLKAAMKSYMESFPSVENRYLV